MQLSNEPGNSNLGTSGGAAWIPSRRASTLSAFQLSSCGLFFLHSISKIHFRMWKNLGFSIKAYFPQFRDATAMAGAIAVILSAIYVMAKGKVTIGSRLMKRESTLELGNWKTRTTLFLVDIYSVDTFWESTKHQDGRSIHARHNTVAFR